MCFITAAAGATAAASSAATVANYALIASMVSGAASMYGQVQQGKVAEDTAKYNKQQSVNEALMQKQAGLEEASNIRTQTRQSIARMNASTAATGVQTTGGSALDIVTEAAGYGAKGEAQAVSNAQRKADSSMQAGDLAIAKGKATKKQSQLGAFNSALGTAGSVADKWYRYGA